MLIDVAVYYVEVELAHMEQQGMSESSAAGQGKFACGRVLWASEMRNMALPSMPVVLWGFLKLVAAWVLQGRWWKKKMGGDVSFLKRFVALFL